MSEENKMEEFVSYVENLTVLELSKLVKTLEERLGVSAAAPVAVAAAPYGAHSVYHLFAWQVIGTCHLAFTGPASAERSALCQQPRPCRPVNCSVYTAATKQRVVSGIHNRVRMKPGNISGYNAEVHF